MTPNELGRGSTNKTSSTFERSNYMTTRVVTNGGNNNENADTLVFPDEMTNCVGALRIRTNVGDNCLARNEPYEMVS